MEPLSTAAIMAVLLDKSIAFMLPRLGEAMEAMQGSAKRQQAEAFTRSLAAGITPDNALVVVAVCDPRSGDGVWRRWLRFTLVVHNVAPVVLRIDGGTVEAEAFQRAALVRTDGARLPPDATVRDIEPGAAAYVPLELEAEVCPGRSAEEWQALHVEVKAKLRLFGPTENLCTVVTKNAVVWMPCREKIK